MKTKTVTKTKKKTTKREIFIKGKFNEHFFQTYAKNRPWINLNDDEGYYTEESHAIPIDPEQSIDYNIIDPNEKVIRRETITVRYDYPLSCDVDIVFKHKGGWTRKQLFNVIQKGYVKVYQEHDSGKENYGIWGHDIGDLVLGGVWVKSNGMIILGVDS